MAASHENLPGAESPHLGADFPNVRDVAEVSRPARRDAAADAHSRVARSERRNAVRARDRRRSRQPPFAGPPTNIRCSSSKPGPSSWKPSSRAAAASRLLDAARARLARRRVRRRAAAYADRLVTLVAADRAAAQDYVGFLSDGRIHRLLIKPPAVGATRLLIESATARRLQLREEPANDDAPDGDRGGPSRFLKWRWPAAAGAASVALLATRDRRPRGSGGGTASRAEQRLDRDDRRRCCRRRRPCRRPRTSLPTTARRPRSRVRKAVSPSPSATTPSIIISRFSRWHPRTRRRAAAFRPSSTRLFDARRRSAARRLARRPRPAALDHVRRVDPASSRLAFLDAQLARALAALAASPSAPANAAASPAALPTELDSVLSLATARLRRGQLLSPAGDSARAYLDRARELESHRSARRSAANGPRRGVDRGGASRVRFRRRGGHESRRAKRGGSAPSPRCSPRSSAMLAAARAQRRAARLAERLETARAPRAERRIVRAGRRQRARSSHAACRRMRPISPGLPRRGKRFGKQACSPSKAPRQGRVGGGRCAARRARASAGRRSRGGAARGRARGAAGCRRRFLATAVPASELRVQSVGAGRLSAGRLSARGIEGWVELEYVVDRTGRPRNLVVVQASPTGRFDAAALAAVAQYRYVPFERRRPRLRAPRCGCACASRCSRRSVARLARQRLFPRAPAGAHAVRRLMQHGFDGADEPALDLEDLGDGPRPRNLRAAFDAPAVR